MFMPLDFIFRWAAGLFSIALLGSGVYILHEWYEHELIDRAWLIAGWSMIAWSCIGFLPLTLLRRLG